MGVCVCVYLPQLAKRAELDLTLTIMQTGLDLNAALNTHTSYHAFSEVDKTINTHIRVKG